MLGTYSIIFIIFGYTYAREITDPLVNTNQGLIRGLRAEDGDYSMFLGIPYAKVDRSNPFGAPLKHPPFETVFEAYDDSAKCPQLDEQSFQPEGTLDCLHINIYVPNNATSTSKLPVLLWIYGGGFQIGEAGRFIYGPKYLVRHDVIVVSLNYRVGPYGFLCLDIPEVPGNAGLKDQLLGLRWIKDNIEAFGGDANQITAFGQSAGAGSVEMHILSKYEKLFDKAILQSGSALGPGLWLPSNTNNAFIISEKLGFVSNNLSETVSFLSTVDPLLVIEASSGLSIEYRACVEKTFENVESFISEQPGTTVISKDKLMPIFSGYNDREFLVGINTGFYSDNFFSNALDIVFDVDDNMKDIVRRFYIGDEKISDDVQLQIIDCVSDLGFNYPAQRSIFKHIREGAPNVYHYVFSYEGQRNYMKKLLNITNDGTAHTDEVGYLFDVSYFDPYVTKEDQLMIDRITTLWTNFAKYGDPTPEASELIPLKLSPVTENVLHYLKISSELSLGTRPFKERLAFWDLFYEANRDKLRGF